MEYNFDFNGDSLGPEQDHLFDDLLDDLAFESEINNFDANNFLGKSVSCAIKSESAVFESHAFNVSLLHTIDFDFGAGVLGKTTPLIQALTVTKS